MTEAALARISKVTTHHVDSRRKVVNIDHRDGPYRRFSGLRWASKVAASDPLLRGYEFTQPLQLDCSRWIVANGDARRVEVRRSVLVKDKHSYYEPVAKFAAVNGLVLSDKKTMEDPEFMHCNVHVEVYTAPGLQ